MAFRGPYIFDGYITGRGRVRVFQDLDNSDYFFCLALKGDKQYYVRREIVKGIPKAKKPSVKPSSVDDTELEKQPTLF